MADTDFFQLGLSAFKIGQYENAINLFHKAIDEDNNNPKIWNAFGVTLSKQGDFISARKCFENALMMDPGNITYEKNRDKNEKQIPISRNVNEPLKKESNINSKKASSGSFLLKSLGGFILVFLTASIIAAITIGYSGPDNTGKTPSNITYMPTVTPTETEDLFDTYYNEKECYSIDYPKGWIISKSSSNNEFQFIKDPQERARIEDLVNDDTVTITNPGKIASLTIKTDYDAVNYDFEEYINSIYNQYRSARGMGLLTGKKYNLNKEKLQISNYPAYIIKFSDYEEVIWGVFCNTGEKIIQLNYNGPRGKNEDIQEIFDYMIKSMRIS